jgi:hypothetical protein
LLNPPIAESLRSNARFAPPVALMCPCRGSAFFDFPLSQAIRI